MGALVDVYVLTWTDDTAREEYLDVDRSLEGAMSIAQGYGPNTTLEWWQGNGKWYAKIPDGPERWYRIVKECA